MKRIASCHCNGKRCRLGFVGQSAHARIGVVLDLNLKLFPFPLPRHPASDETVMKCSMEGRTSLRHSRGCDADSVVADGASACGTPFPLRQRRRLPDHPKLPQTAGQAIAWTRPYERAYRRVVTRRWRPCLHRRGSGKHEEAESVENGQVVCSPNAE